MNGHARTGRRDARLIWMLTAASAVGSFAAARVILHRVPTLQGVSQAAKEAQYLRAEPERVVVQFMNDLYGDGAANAPAHRLSLQERERVDADHVALRGFVFEEGPGDHHRHPISFLVARSAAGWAVADVYVDDEPATLRNPALRAYAHGPADTVVSKTETTP